MILRLVCGLSRRQGASRLVGLLAFRSLAVVALPVWLSGCSGTDSHREEQNGLSDRVVAGCRDLPVESREIRIARAGEGAMAHTGPGADYPRHERGRLRYGEHLYVIQECRGWLQARAVPAAVVGREIRRLGPGRVPQDLLFWVRADHVR